MLVEYKPNRHTSVAVVALASGPSIVAVTDVVLARAVIVRNVQFPAASSQRIWRPISVVKKPLPPLMAVAAEAVTVTEPVVADRPSVVVETFVFRKGPSENVTLVIDHAVSLVRVILRTG